MFIMGTLETCFSGYGYVHGRINEPSVSPDGTINFFVKVPGLRQTIWIDIPGARFEVDGNNSKRLVVTCDVPGCIQLFDGTPAQTVNIACGAEYSQRLKVAIDFLQNSLPKPKKHF